MSSRMKKSESVFTGVRLPPHVSLAVERERQRASQASGFRIGKSAVIIDALEQHFGIKNEVAVRRSRKARAA